MWKCIDSPPDPRATEVEGSKLIAFTGYFISSELGMAVGILLFAHSSFDRIWGYVQKLNHWKLIF